MADFPIMMSGRHILPGEAYLSETPVLRSHAGTQPDLYLHWNTIPLSAAALDIVVYLHGFSREGEAMRLAEKVETSGLDLSARNRPTLAILPRGNWLRHYYYDFPALLAGGIDRLIDYGLQRLGAALAGISPDAPGILRSDRFILAAHSGGGMPAIDVIAARHQPPDELYVFDGLYGRDPATGSPLQGIEVVDRWLDERFRQEPRHEGALRVVYIEQQTGAFSQRVAQLIAARLASLDPGLAARLAPRYRVELSPIQHSQISRCCLPELLSASDAEFEWFR